MAAQTHSPSLHGLVKDCHTDCMIKWRIEDFVQPTNGKLPPPAYTSHLSYAPAATYSLKEKYNWISVKGVVRLTKQKNRV